MRVLALVVDAGGRCGENGHRGDLPRDDMPVHVLERNQDAPANLEPSHLPVVEPWTVLALKPA